VRKRLSFARRATADLDEVWDYSEGKWGRDQADRYATEIARRCGDLVDGKIVPQEISLKSGRFLRIRSGSHFIFCATCGTSFAWSEFSMIGEMQKRRLVDLHSTQSSPISR
jgi:toxin ParE1/3/4